MLLDQVLDRARGKGCGSALLIGREFLAQPGHGTVEVVQGQPVHAGDGVIGHPLLAGPVRAGHHDPVQHGGEDGPLDRKLEPALSEQILRPGIALRPDYDAAQLWALAKATRGAGQSRRLLALAEIYDGGSRTKAAQVGGVGLQTIRDWVVRFNARGPDGLIDGKAPGNTCKLNDRQRQALVNIVERGPMPAIHGVVRWRLKDLAMWIWEEFRISLSETTLSRELRSLGYRKLSAR